MKVISIYLKRFRKFKYFKWVLRLLVVGIIVTVIWSMAGSKNKPICEKCNVILVSLDTLSALHLPCYGYERNTAPNLCAYADKNLLFLNSYSQAPITLDSHFSIFTSLYPNSHKMVNIFGESLSEKYLTLPQLFRMNGYKTVYNGPLQDYHLPLNRGIERGFDVIENREVGQSDVQNWSKSFQKLLNNKREGKSTFLFLHTYAVHEPFLTGHEAKPLFTDLPEYPNISLTYKEFHSLSPGFSNFILDFILGEYYSKSGSPDVLLDRSIAQQIRKSKNPNEILSLFGSLSSRSINLSLLSWYEKSVDKKDPKQIEYLKALYDEQIYNLNNSLSQLLEFISDPRISKDTILIITADHGEEFMEHGFLFHGHNLYQTSTRVPLIIHIPGVEPRKINEIVQGIDIYPTVLSLVGLKPESKIEGIDLTGIIKGDNNEVKNEYLLSEFNGIAGVQMDNWRFYYRIKEKKPLKLYNLDADPLEKNNIISQNRMMREEFLKLMDKLNISYF